MRAWLVTKARCARRSLDAEDLAQAALYRTVRLLVHGRKLESVCGCLLSAMNSVAVAEYRRRSRDRREGALLECDAELLESEGSASDDTACATSGDLLAKILAACRPSWRKTLLTLGDCDCCIREAARRLGTQPQSVRRTLRRIAAAFGSLLDESGLGERYPPSVSSGDASARRDSRTNDNNGDVG